MCGEASSTSRIDRMPKEKKVYGEVCMVLGPLCLRPRGLYGLKARPICCDLELEERRSDIANELCHAQLSEYVHTSGDNNDPGSGGGR